MRDVFLTNGMIYTLDQARPRAKAMAFVNGRVAAFDDEAKALLASHTEVVDLRERTCIPGSAPRQHLLETRVDQTVVGGEIVYGG